MKMNSLLPKISEFDIPRYVRPPKGPFSSQGDAFGALLAHSKAHGYFMRVKRSKPDNVPGDKKRVWFLECDRQGVYKPTPRQAGKKGKTRACGCIAKVVIRRVSYTEATDPDEDPDEEWIVESQAYHNHPSSLGPEAHPTLRREVLLQGDERLEAVRLLARGTRPAEVLDAINEEFPSNLMIPRNIYKL
jgi:hypothetical protein